MNPRQPDATQRRMAFAATAIFLRLNQQRILVSPDEGERFIVKDVIQSKATLKEMASRIERHLNTKQDRLKKTPVRKKLNRFRNKR